MTVINNHCRTFLLVYLILNICVFVPTSSFAETGKFEGKGDSPLETYDMRVARGLAIKRGARAALEEAVESLLNPKIFREKYDLLDKTVFSNQEKFVTGSTVLSEGRVEKKYEVVVLADVNMSALRAALVQIGLLLPPEKMPAWMIVIPEKVGDAPQRSAWIGNQPSIAESQLTEIIKRYGYRIVKAQTGTGLAPEIAMNPEEHLSDIIAAAKQMGATHVLIGESVFNSGRGVTRKEYSMGTAQIDLKAVEVAGGNVVGQSSERISLELPAGNAIDKSVISAACYKLRDEVWGWLNKVNPSGAAGFNEVYLRLTGFVTYAEYSAVVNVLEENVPGMHKVTLRSLARGEAEIQVRFFGEAAELAKQLIAYKFKGFTLEKGGEADGKTVLKVIPLPD